VPLPRSLKIAPEIDARLYEELVSVAKENGQSRGLCWSGRCSERYRELYKKLAR
jgi:hypothetical protein